jgi:hypothetical protein
MSGGIDYGDRILVRPEAKNETASLAIALESGRSKHWWHLFDVTRAAYTSWLKLIVDALAVREKRWHHFEVRNYA